MIPNSVKRFLKDYICLNMEDKETLAEKKKEILYSVSCLKGNFMVTVLLFEGLIIWGLTFTLTCIVEKLSFENIEIFFTFTVIIIQCFLFKLVMKGLKTIIDLKNEMLLEISQDEEM